MDPAREVAHLGDRALRLLVRLADELLRALGIGVELLLRPPEIHRERDEPLLHPVVQVALDLPPVLFRQVDGRATRGGELAHALGHVASEHRAHERPVHRRDPADDPRRHEEHRETRAEQERPRPRRVDDPPVGDAADLHDAAELRSVHDEPDVRREPAGRLGETKATSGATRSPRANDHSVTTIVNVTTPIGISSRWYPSSAHVAGILRPRELHPPPRDVHRIGPIRRRHLGVEQHRRPPPLEPPHRPRHVEQRDEDRDPDQRDEEPEPERHPRHDDRERHDPERHVEKEVDRLLPRPSLERRSKRPHDRLRAPRRGGRRGWDGHRCVHAHRLGLRSCRAMDATRSVHGGVIPRSDLVRSPGRSAPSRSDRRGHPFVNVPEPSSGRPSCRLAL